VPRYFKGDRELFARALFWEGHDFSRATNSFEHASALAPEVCFYSFRDFFAAL